MEEAVEETVEEEIAEEAIEEEVMEEEKVEEDQLDTPDGKGLVVYLMLGSMGWQGMTPTMNEEFGTSLGYDVRIMNPENNLDQQLQQFDTALAMDPVAIILNPVDSAGVIAHVEEARSKGIPIFVWDRFITDTYIDFTSATSTVAIGKQTAIEFVDFLKDKHGEEKGVVLEIMGDLGDNYAVTLDQGFQEILKDYPNIEVITKDTPGWDVAISAQIVDDQLTARDDIDAIFYHWDGGQGPPISAVLEDQGYEPGDIFTLSTGAEFDGLDLIEQGWLTGTYPQPIVRMTWAMWMYMDEILAGEDVIPGTYDLMGLEAEVIIEDWGPTLYLPGDLVTIDNLDEPTLWFNLIEE